MPPYVKIRTGKMFSADMQFKDFKRFLENLYLIVLMKSNDIYQRFLIIVKKISVGYPFYIFCTKQFLLC